MRLSIYILVVLVAVDAVFSQAVNGTEDAAEEEIKTSGEITNVAKKKKKDRSTSSSSGAEKSGESGADSLDMAESGGSSESESQKKRTKIPSYVPKSSEERRGWRKWHRKCKQCPTDMKKKWRDFTIMWICGGYQRARRSFKSKCMMEYRNCQDGTMFVEMYTGRCKNDTGKESYFHGDHFFYEYKVAMSYESSDSKSKDSTSQEEESEQSY